MELFPELFVDKEEDDKEEEQDDEDEFIVGIVRFNIFISCNHERFVRLSSNALNVVGIIVEIRDGVFALCVVKTCVVSFNLFGGTNVKIFRWIGHCVIEDL
jgi:hypothetical protein